MDRSIRLKNDWEKQQADKWKPEYGTAKLPQPTPQELQQRQLDIEAKKLPF